MLAPGVLNDQQTAREVFRRALDARGLEGDFAVAADEDGLRAAVAAGAGGGEVLLLTADTRDVTGLDLALGGSSIIRIDLCDREPDRSPAVRRHVRGRGLAGIRFAVEAWFFHRTAPATLHSYGRDRDQRAELRLPPGTGPFPVAVLVHGGYWRARWENDLMDALAVDLTGRGYATWNVEYRKPAEHGWDATTADVAASLQALAGVDAPLDLRRIVTFGHSAGGQLVVRLAADRVLDTGVVVRPAFTVSLAGCLDLVSIDQRWLSEGAASHALGGRAEEIPAVYAASSPLLRLPLGAPVAVVVGVDDDLDLLDVSRSFAAAAVAAGDDVATLEGPGHHFSVIDPSSEIWADVVALVMQRVAPRG